MPLQKSSYKLAKLRNLVQIFIINKEIEDKGLYILPEVTERTKAARENSTPYYIYFPKRSFKSEKLSLVVGVFGLLLVSFKSHPF